MSNRPTVDFQTILSESDIPTTEAELESKLKNEVTGAGSSVSNDSEMSPFWSWVRAAVVTPVVWLINILLAGYILPNMFVATAERWALELKAWELNVTPNEAVKTQGYISFTKNNIEDSVVITAGSIIQTLPINGIVYQVHVLITTVIESGLETGLVLVEGTEVGAAYNLPAGYFNILPEELSGIASAVNETNWITTLGADAETDEELAFRLQNAFTSAGSWHIDDAYRSIITDVAGIRSDNIYFLNTGNISPGTATAYILMEVGETPDAILTQLNTRITTDGYHGHGDVMTCSAIPEQTYELVADIVLSDNLTDEQKIEQKTEVENRIRAAFRETAAFPETTRANPSSRFSFSNLHSEIHNSMPLVKSVKLSVNGNVQEDIESGLVQPRISSLLVQEVS